MKRTEKRSPREGVGHHIFVPDNTHGGRIETERHKHRASCQCGFRGKWHDHLYQASDDLHDHHKSIGGDAIIQEHEHFDPAYLRVYSVMM